ncbi:hypothetical protein R80B4_02511 [Fibrobacteres bacterium R8-0-B4]
MNKCRLSLVMSVVVTAPFDADASRYFPLALPKAFIEFTFLESYMDRAMLSLQISATVVSLVESEASV